MLHSLSTGYLCRPTGGPGGFDTGPGHQSPPSGRAAAFTQKLPDTRDRGPGAGALGEVGEAEAGARGGRPQSTTCSAVTSAAVAQAPRGRQSARCRTDGDGWCRAAWRTWTRARTDPSAPRSPPQTSPGRDACPDTVGKPTVHLTGPHIPQSCPLCPSGSVTAGTRPDTGDLVSPRPAVRQPRVHRTHASARAASNTGRGPEPPSPRDTTARGNLQPRRPGHPTAQVWGAAGPHRGLCRAQIRTSPVLVSQGGSSLGLCAASGL